MTVFAAMAPLIPFTMSSATSFQPRCSNIITPEARDADLHVLDLFERGDHRSVIEEMPAYKKHGPEGKFGHYLIMAGAIGGAACTAKAELFSEYEASVGTGQVHVWFERPEGGWTG